MIFVTDYNLDVAIILAINEKTKKKIFSISGLMSIEFAIGFMEDALSQLKKSQN